MSERAPHELRPVYKQLQTMLRHTTVVLVLLTVGYYLIPLDPRETGTTAARVLGALAAFAGLGLALRLQWRRSRRQQTREFVVVEWLLSSLYVLILVFALAYGLAGIHGDAQFDGIATRTDALYFSVTVTSTVGFGDITATGTFGKVLVTVHMLFNLIYLGTALRMLSQMRPTGSRPA